jgi:hypothetical protein
MLNALTDAQLQNRRELAGEALDAIKLAIQTGIESRTYGEFTLSDEYVALDIARCTLEAIPAGVNPVEDAYEVVRRWRHRWSEWSAARA